MKKIIIVTHNFPPESVGGASRIYEMARELQKSFHVEVICSPPTYPFTKFPFSKKLITHETVNGINIHRVWTYQPKTDSPSFFERIAYYTFHSILASLYLMKKCKGCTIIIITTPPPTLLISSIIARICRKKVVIDMRDLWIDAAISLGYIKNKVIISIFKKFEKYCLNKSWMIITNSLYIQNLLKKTYAKKRIEYYPFNVNTEQFQKISCEKENELVYIGNIGKAQNLEKLIQSVALVVKKIPNLKLVIYGGGDNESQIKEMVKKLELQENIFIKNPIPRDQIHVVLSKSKIGIIPLADNSQLAYAIPTKTFEYFACELPVIAYGRSDELKRVISESNAGFYIEEGYEKVAEKIQVLLKDKELMYSFGKSGRKFVLQQNKCLFLDERNYE